MLSAVWEQVRRRFSLLVVAGAAFATSIAVVSGPPEHFAPLIRFDGEGYHIWTYAILRGNLDFSPYRETYIFAGIYPTRDNWCHCKYSPGAALIHLPVMAFVADRGVPPPVFSREEQLACFFMGVAALLLTAHVALRSCRRIGAPEWAGHTAVLAVFFGTGLFSYGTFETSYSHIWSALGFALLIDQGLAARCGPVTRRRAVAVGVTAFVLVLVRNTNLIGAAILGIGFARWQRRGGMPFGKLLLSGAIGIALGMAVMIALNSNAHGRLVFSSYAGEEFLWGRPLQWSVLTSYEQGLFLYYPILLLVLAAGLVCRVAREATLGYALFLGAYVFLYGYWWAWSLGGGFGHRGFVELSPPAIPLLAFILGSLPRWGRGVLLPLIALAVFVTLELMHGHWRATLPWHTQTSEPYWDHVVGGRSVFGWFRP